VEQQCHLQRSAPLAYQWQFNSTNIGGATSSSYTRLCALGCDEGNYRVTVTNLAGRATSQPAMLSVPLPQAARFGQLERLPDKRIHITWTGEPGWSYQLQTSTNVSFSPSAIIGPISGSNGSFEWVDDEATNDPQRFYRFQP
jgi:hypothetical protein